MAVILIELSLTAQCTTALKDD